MFFDGRGADPGVVGDEVARYARRGSLDLVHDEARAVLAFNADDSFEARRAL
jgi:hypothetical protein